MTLVSGMNDINDVGERKEKHYEFLELLDCNFFSSLD